MPSFHAARKLGLALAAVAAAIPAVLATGSAQAVVGQAVTASTTSQATTQLPDTQEVYNPGRGMYEWLEQAALIPTWSMPDIYWRDQLQWGSQIERTPGIYDFTQIEKGLAAAAARQGKFHLRIMPYCPGCGGNLTPAYVPRQANGVADWNSEGYLSAYERLFRAIGAKYNKDPRLGFIDIGAYGPFGEWVCDNTCGTEITDANAMRVARAAADALPDKFVLMNFDRYASMATSYSPRIGVRFDCVGGLSSNVSLNWYPEPMRSVWKHAPVVGEWCNWGQTTPTQGMTDVQNLHLSLISSGNYPRTYGAMSAQERADLAKTYIATGYRNAVTGSSFPSSAKAGSTFNVTTTWTNTGVAPTYDNWRPEIRLLDSSGKAVASFPINLELKNLLPGTMSATTSVTIPSTLRGTYTLAVAVVDKEAYLKPMGLANTGRDAAGNYPLGTISLASARRSVNRTATAGAYSAG